MLRVTDFQQSLLFQAYHVTPKGWSAEGHMKQQSKEKNSLRSLNLIYPKLLWTLVSGWSWAITYLQRTCGTESSTQRTELGNVP